MSTILEGGQNIAPMTPVRNRRPAIWQPRQPAFWLLLILIVAGAFLTVIELAFSASSLSAAAAAGVLIAIQATLLALIARAMPRFRRQSGSLRLAALLWGLAVVPAVAIIANSTANLSVEALGFASFSASLTAPINEDLLRILGVLIILSLAQTRRLTVMDGAVYGFIVGAGFELVENLLYALRGDDFLATLSVGFTRLFVGFGLHALWTTLAGAALAYCLSRRQLGASARWWVLVPAITIPMLLHAGWDAPDFSIFAIFKLLSLFGLYALSVASFFYGTRWGRRSEFGWYVEQGHEPTTLAEFTRLPRAERKRLAADAVSAEDRG